MSTVTLKGYVIVPDTYLADVERELHYHIQLSRQEKGCITFEVSQDPENTNRFNVYEEFVSQDAFIFHQQRLAETAWGRISEKLEKHYNTTGIIQNSNS